MAAIMHDMHHINNAFDSIKHSALEIYNIGFRAGLAEGGVNISFSEADIFSSDEELKRYQEQRRARGFDDTEFWDFERTIAKFMVPRLKVIIETLKAEKDTRHRDCMLIPDCEKMLEGFTYALTPIEDLCSEYEVIKRRNIIESIQTAFDLLAKRHGDLHVFPGEE